MGQEETASNLHSRTRPFQMGQFPSEPSGPRSSQATSNPEFHRDTLPTSVCLSALCPGKLLRLSHPSCDGPRCPEMPQVPSQGLTHGREQSGKAPTSRGWLSSGEKGSPTDNVHG